MGVPPLLEIENMTDKKDKKKPDEVTMLYSADADFRDFDGTIDQGTAQGLNYITTTDVAGAKKAGWVSLADAQEKAAKKAKKSNDG